MGRFDTKLSSSDSSATRLQRSVGVGLGAGVGGDNACVGILTGAEGMLWWGNDEGGDCDDDADAGVDTGVAAAATGALCGNASLDEDRAAANAMAAESKPPSLPRRVGGEGVATLEDGGDG